MLSVVVFNSDKVSIRDAVTRIETTLVPLPDVLGDDESVVVTLVVAEINTVPDDFLLSVRIAVSV